MLPDVPVAWLGQGERTVMGRVLYDSQVTGWMAGPLSETRNTEEGIHRTRGEDDFDLVHSEFEVPMGDQLSNGHRGEKQVWASPARKWLLKSTRLDEISQDESAYVSYAAEKRRGKCPLDLAISRSLVTSGTAPRVEWSEKKADGSMLGSSLGK